MFKLKEKNNIEFLWVCLKIGLGVLVYRGTMEIVGTLLSLPLTFLATYLTDPQLIAIINYGVQIVYTIISFAAAALTLGISLRVGKSSNYQPMKLKLRHPLLAPFLIISTVALNYAAAEVNSIIINLLSSGVMQSMGSTTEIAKMGWVEIILLFVSTAVLPAILEEVIFRGYILSNLAPYGRGMAIVSSALLFGLMHMNPQQFFYTTLMGVVLGYVYVKTESLWVCIAIHFVNNGLAVLQEVLFGRLEYAQAVMYSSGIMLAMAVLGLLSMGVLILVRVRERRSAPEEIGSFGRTYEPSLSYEERPVSRRGKILMFFSPSVSLFTFIVFSSMLSTAATLMILGFIYGFIPDILSF